MNKLIKISLATPIMIGANLHASEAIADYLTMTIGRQPSADGPGMSLRQNTPRQATYPSILFDGNADGLIFTANAGSVKGILNDTSFRVAYGKSFQKGDAIHGYMTSDNDLDVLGLFAETSIDAPSMGENLIVLSYVNATGSVTNDINDTNLGDFNLAGIFFENNKAFGTNIRVPLSCFASY